MKADEPCSGLTDPIPVTGMSWREVAQRPLTPAVKSTRAMQRKPGIDAFMVLNLITFVSSQREQMDKVMNRAWTRLAGIPSECGID